MRKMFGAAGLICVFLFSACGGGEKQNAAEPKRSVPAPDQNVPIDLGDPTQPVQVRALRNAKEVKKQIDAQRKQNQPVVDATN